jgi:hypothetical protein
VARGLWQRQLQPATPPMIIIITIKARQASQSMSGHVTQD